MWQWWIRVEKNLHIKATAYHLGLMVRAMLQPLALLTLLAAAAVRLNAWSIAYALSVGTMGRVSDAGSQPHTQARSPAAHPRSPPTYRYKQQILDAMESDDEKLAVDILFRAIQVRLWSRPT